MNNDELQQFQRRIDKLLDGQKPTFGKMNVNQMVCHCADQLRMAMGTRHSTEYGKVEPKEIMTLVKLGKTVPTPKGFGQVEGEGTTSTTLEKDKEILKELLEKFTQLENGFSYPPHPYFGQLTKDQWVGLVRYHLNHHLGQFKV